MVDTVKPFNEVVFKTQDGETIRATKNNDVITISGDKNGIRQMELNEFMQFLTNKSPKVDKTPSCDTVSFSDKVKDNTKNKTADKTIEQKQEILQKARTKAAGCSLLFGSFYTLYYGLRSDKKVAQEFDLDETKDKNFIKTIKRQQILCTLPSMIPGIGLDTGIACWLYNKNLDSSKLNV